MSAPFALIPFAPPPVALSIEGEVRREGRGLRADYRLRGELAAIAVPPRAARPERRDELWRATCFELFLSAGEGTGYCEVNCSPSGDWNAYSFSDYRQGMTVADVTRFNCWRRTSGDTLSLSFAIEFADAISDESLIGVSAVILHQSGETGYWALAHTGAKPDFHRGDARRLRLLEATNQ